MAKKADPGELLGAEPVERLEANVRAALRRKLAHEASIAGCLRSLAPFSTRLSGLVAHTVDTLAQRRSFERALYAGTVRALAELDDKACSKLLCRAIEADDGCDLATLSAACFVDDGGLSRALARVAAGRHPHLAFAAEVARLSRGEAGGQHIEAIAPRVKESHRIALCMEIFVPLLQKKALPVAIAPALTILRDAERHLGRWLVFGEIAVRSGDRRPLEEARERATAGPSSARAAWTLVSWALGNAESPPGARPTVELVSRLSDRPSADRDPTFLFRMAEARVEQTRSMLENFVRGPLFRTETGVRAALYLARDHGRDDMVPALAELASSARHDQVRGMAAGALFDLGVRDSLATVADELVQSRKLCTMSWGALVRAGLAGKLKRVMTEPTFRRVQLGWVE